MGACVSALGLSPNLVMWGRARRSWWWNKLLAALFTVLSLGLFSPSSLFDIYFCCAEGGRTYFYIYSYSQDGFSEGGCKWYARLLLHSFVLSTSVRIRII